MAQSGSNVRNDRLVTIETCTLSLGSGLRSLLLVLDLCPSCPLKRCNLPAS